MLRNYKIAGALAITSAVITIPSMILMVIDLFTESATLGLVNAAIQAISAVIFVLLMLYLRGYLEERLSLGKQTILFGFIITTGLLIYAVSITASFLDPVSSILTSLVAMVPSIALGILLMVVAFRIINSKVPDIGYAKGFAYLVGATGLLNATILLSDLAVMTNLASDILMALMFFAAGKAGSAGAEATPQLADASAA